MTGKLETIAQPYDVTLIYVYRTSPANNILHDILPLGIYYISAFLRKSGYHVRTLFISAHDMIERLLEIIDENRSHIIGFSCFEDNFHLICNAVRFIKKRTDKIRILIGGPQTVGLDDAIFDHIGCDAAIIGEGEFVVKALADYYLRFEGSIEDIPNVVYKKDGIIKCNPIQYTENIDALSYPDIEDLPDTQSFFCITGRGCPFNCAFCFEGSNSRTVRYRSIDNIIEEIDTALKKRPYINTIHFLDDTFTLDPTRVHKLCQYLTELRKAKPIRWICEAHILTLYKHSEMISEMVQAGLEAMHVGIESGSNKVLKAYGKNITREMIVDVVKMCKSANLQSFQGNIIVGGAWESQETIMESQKLIQDLIKHGRGMVELYTTYLWPYPNTPISQCPERYGLQILKEERERAIFSMRSPVMRTESMSRDDIIKNCNKLDMILQNEIRNACLQMTKAEICHFWDNNKKRFTGFWGQYLNLYPHLVQFMSEAEYSERAAKFDLDEQYPIRTFNVLEYKDNALKFYTHSFDGLKKKVLELSTGNYSIIDLSRMFQVKIEDIVNVCNELQDQCLIYLSNC